MSKIRDGVTIKVRPGTRQRLRNAKKARGKGDYDALFNWMLDQVEL